MTKAALYVRVSTEEQAREGTSIDAQLDRLRHYAKFKSWHIVGEFKDEGVSGKDDNRPELRRLMTIAQRKQVDIIAVSKLDRFMRNTRLLLQYIDDLKRSEVGFIATDDNIDTTDTKTGSLMLTILAAVAEWERERLSERIRDARKCAAAQGRWLMGRTLLGYKWDKDKGFQIVEEEAKVVRMIYDWYTSNDLGAMEIANELNRRGYRTRNGGHWSKASVRLILCHPAYANKAQPYYYPPIAPEAIWETAQRKRPEKNRIKKNTKSWLLQGMGICGLCGHRLACRQRDPNSKRWYQCTGRDKEAHMDDSKRCTLQRIEADWLEKEVWSKFVAAISDSDILRKSIQDAVAKLEDRKRDMDTTSQPINQQLENINKRIKKLATAIEFTEDDLTESDLADFKEKLEKYKKEKAILQDRKDNLSPEIQAEVIQLEDYIAWINKLLDKGGVVVEPDGIWAYEFDENGGLVAAENFGSSLDIEATVERATRPKKPRQSPKWKEGEGYYIRVNMANFRQSKEEARTASMRAILQKFVVKVVVFHDRIEVRGLVPIESINMPVEVVRGNGGREINSLA
ncbi:recombinase family protein [Chloroflexota bacterium]